MFTRERDDTLLIFKADKQTMDDEQATSVEQVYCDFYRATVHDAIIDLTGVGMISSHFASWLVCVHLDVNKNNGQVIVCSVGEHVLDILKNLHLTSLFVIAYDVCAAKQIIDHKQPAS